MFRGYSGETLHVVTRLYDAELSRRRDLSVLESELKHQAEWRELRVGRLRVVVLEVREVSHAVRALADRGTYCYV